MSWYRRTGTPKPEADSLPPPAPAGADSRPRGLPGFLRADVGRRVTLMWRCGPAVASTTGWIVKADRDVVEVRGAVRTFAEAVGRVFRRNCDVVELSTVIPVRHVCALIEDVPRGVHAALPLYLPTVIHPAAPPATLPDPQGASRSAERRGVVVDFVKPLSRRMAAGA